MDRLQEIEQRLNAATPGRWSVEWAEDEYEDTCIISDLDEGVYICQTSYDSLSYSQKHNINEDAEFIAHAKDDIAYLLGLLKLNN